MQRFCDNDMRKSKGRKCVSGLKDRNTLKAAVSEAEGADSSSILFA